MSHVDDGTLHAYLDGELSALEAVRVEAHANECAACRARLADERGLIARASELLEAAVPPERPAPPLRARARPRAWRAQWPLAAAASVVLALAVGWGIGTRPRFHLGQSPGGALSSNERKSQAPSPGPVAGPAALRETPAPATPAAPVELAQAGTPPPAGGLAELDERRSRHEVTAAAADLAAAAEPGPQAALAHGAAVGLTNATAAGAAPSRALVPQAEPPSPEGLTVQAGGDIMGAELLGVPGLPVRSVRRARQPGYASVVLVEQALDSAQTIQIVHRRAGPAAGAGLREAEQRPRQEGAARVIDSVTVAPGGLDVVVTGALPADSLAALRRALRPLPR